MLGKPKRVLKQAVCVQCCPHDALLRRYTANQARYAGALELLRIALNLYILVFLLTVLIVLVSV